MSWRRPVSGTVLHAESVARSRSEAQHRIQFQELDRHSVDDFIAFMKGVFFGGASCPGPWDGDSLSVVAFSPHTVSEVNDSPAIGAIHHFPLSLATDHDLDGERDMTAGANASIYSDDAVFALIFQ